MVGEEYITEENMGPAQIQIIQIIIYGEVVSKCFSVRASKDSEVIYALAADLNHC